MPEVQTNAPPGVPLLPMPPGIDGSAPIGDALLERIEWMERHYKNTPELAEWARSLQSRVVVLRTVAARSSSEQYASFARAELEAIAAETSRIEAEIRTQQKRAFTHLLSELAKPIEPMVASAPTTTVRPESPRPRTARRQHTSMTRTTATATAGADSSPSADGSSRSGSASPSPTDDPPPPGRIRLAHTWHIAGISTAPAGSVVSFKAVAS